MSLVQYPHSVKTFADHAPLKSRDERISAAPRDLTERTLSALRATFAGYGHEPSPAMWVGVRALVEILEGMTRGTVEPLAYLSSLDPGVGKTEAVVHFVRQLCASPRHDDVGVLICVSHLKEINVLVENMGLARHEFAAYTTDEATNALGSNDIDDARVLFVTQQMVDSRLSGGRALRDLSIFHFNGEPRQIKIWDEAMLPAEELTLNVDALARLPSLLRKISSPLADTSGRRARDDAVKDQERLDRGAAGKDWTPPRDPSAPKAADGDRDDEGRLCAASHPTRAASRGPSAGSRLVGGRA